MNDNQIRVKKVAFTMIGLILLFFTLLSCQPVFSRVPSLSNANALYQQLLNIPVPSEVSELVVSSDSAEAGLWTAVYFSYKAPSTYFETLSRHVDFAQTSDFNSSVAPISCNSSRMPDDFDYWTEKPISLEGKQCYIGVYFPYVHYLIYEPETQAVDHFVGGMSD